jgi:hypothetical protein
MPSSEVKPESDPKVIEMKGAPRLAGAA